MWTHQLLLLGWVVVVVVIRWMFMWNMMRVRRGIKKENKKKKERAQSKDSGLWRMEGCIMRWMYTWKRR
jgi:hypothetical protein